MHTRTLSLIGSDGFAALQKAKVLLVGVGGVGGWCAEALVRTGIQHLTIVDFDTVALSNINRQIVATSGNIGEPKVSEMQKRLLSINPDADIVAVNGRYISDGKADLSVDFEDYDVVIDAIDSVESKACLIYEASLSSALVFSSMGAGRKLNPRQIKTADFKKVQGCPLARAVRHKMKHTGLFPQKPVMCVYSEELLDQNGTIAPVVGTFGMILSSLVVEALIQKH